MRNVVLLCIVLGAAVALGPTGGNKVLVLLDNFDQKHSHSRFFSSLEGRGYDLSFALATDSELALIRFGEYLYDFLIIFSPSVSDFGGTVDVQNVLDFVDDGHSVLIAASPDIGEPVREIAAECGIEFDNKDAFVIDHFHHDASDAGGEHTLVVADHFVQSTTILGAHPPKPVLFRGIGHAIVEDDKDKLLTEVLTGSSTSYSHNPTTAVKTYPHAAGTSTLLVSALQARNGARVVFSGSIDLFSNEFFGREAQVQGSNDKALSGNAEFAEELTRWTFHERGVLRLRDVEHHKKGEKSKPSFYRVEDDLEFTAIIEQWDGKAWAPFVAKDVQLEFVMLDPYVRETLEADRNGRFHIAFKVPDRYGVFQFKINYRSLGYTAITYAEQISVRPFRHDEFERFIVQAYPYYTASFSMLAGFCLFALIFVHYRPTVTREGAQSR